MGDLFVKWVSSARYDRYREEIKKRNLKSIKSYILVGMMVSVVNIIAQTFIMHTDVFLQGLLLVVYFLSVYLVYRFVLLKGNKNSTLALYFIEEPVMILSILMGTVWDPHKDAITFLLMILVMPIFIIDKPWKVTVYITSNTFLFALLSFLFKDFSVFKDDIIHVLGFYICSVMIELYVNLVHIEGVESYEKLMKKSSIDDVTGLKNRYALKNDTDYYTDMDVMVILATINDFKFFNDMYGHRAGEYILSEFAKDIRLEFVGFNSYLYNGDNVLIILENEGEDFFLEKAKVLSEKISTLKVDGITIYPSCSFGYTYGKVKKDGLQKMIYYADIMLYQALGDNETHMAGDEYKEDLDVKEISKYSYIGFNAKSENIDELTGLPNMTFFRRKSMEYLENIVDRTRQIAFVYFNLENLKSYNEEYGFKKGDELLIFIADTLTEYFNRRIVARFGEDHFVVMCYAEGVEETINQVCAKVNEYHNRMSTKLKAGICIYADEEDVTIPCDHAKLACDSIKGAFDVNYKFYDESFEKSNRIHEYIINNIDEAVEREYIKVYYQPIVSSETGEMVGMEALSRWVDPKYGMLSPGDFITVLENSRLIDKLDMFVVKRVCMDYKEQCDKGIKPTPVSMNLSRKDFMLTDVVGNIIGYVEEYKVNPKDIHIEITESALSDNFDDLIEKIDSFRDYGFEIYLDDFGSEYSSLNLLQDFEFDVMKIDMKFLRSFKVKKNSAIIIETIVSLARKIGVKSLAEGVETKEQYEFLKSLGCDMIQGYLFSRPKPLEDVLRAPVNTV
ncbi:MAG: bifunctional diguanylate cyclase/phosphodiesterase [Lachnospiraceae bacterium]|nr:bifunctional diguanylate cyclase/phosphodiesterase [Lachnospiraceae bacterium]